MTVSNASLGRLAISSIIGVLGFVALNQSCGVMPNVAIWWLLYCIGCGTVLNSEAGEAPKALAVLSILPAAVPVLMLGFFVVAKKPVCVSLPSPWIPLILPPASWFAIFVFSFARTPLSGFVETIGRAETEAKAKRAVSVIQLIIGGVTGTALALLTLGRS
jgi:hypothetical protein